MAAPEKKYYPISTNPKIGVRGGRYCATRGIPSVFTISSNIITGCD